MVVVVRQQAVADHGAFEIAPLVFGWARGCELPVIEVRGQGLLFPAGHDVRHAGHDPGLPGFVPDQAPALGQRQALGHRVFMYSLEWGLNRFSMGAGSATSAIACLLGAGADGALRVCEWRSIASNFSKGIHLYTFQRNLKSTSAFLASQARLADRQAPACCAAACRSGALAAVNARGESSGTCSQLKRHCQFPSVVPGVFMRCSPSRPGNPARGRWRYWPARPWPARSASRACSRGG